MIWGRTLEHLVTLHCVFLVLLATAERSELGWMTTLKREPVWVHQALYGYLCSACSVQFMAAKRRPYCNFILCCKIAQRSIIWPLQGWCFHDLDSPLQIPTCTKLPHQLWPIQWQTIVTWMLTRHHATKVEHPTIGRSEAGTVTQKKATHWRYLSWSFSSCLIAVQALWTELPKQSKCSCAGYTSLNSILCCNIY